MQAQINIMPTTQNIIERGLRKIKKNTRGKGVALIVQRHSTLTQIETELVV
jgi:hypothetical protein